MKMESTSNLCKEKVKKICRCITPPMGTPFKEGSIYRWDYGINNSVIVFHKCGLSWCRSETEFATRFQRLNGEG